MSLCRLKSMLFFSFVNYDYILCCTQCQSIQQQYTFICNTNQHQLDLKNCSNLFAEQVYSSIALLSLITLVWKYYVNTHTYNPSVYQLNSLLKNCLQGKNSNNEYYFSLLPTLQMLTGSRGQEFLHQDTKLPLTQQRMVPMCEKKKCNNNGQLLYLNNIHSH